VTKATTFTDKTVRSNVKKIFTHNPS